MDPYLGIARYAQSTFYNARELHPDYAIRQYGTILSMLGTNSSLQTNGITTNISCPDELGPLNPLLKNGTQTALQNELSGMCQKNQPGIIIRGQKLRFTQPFTQPWLRKILPPIDSPCDVATQSLLYEAAIPHTPPLIPYGMNSSLQTNGITTNISSPDELGPLNPLLTNGTQTALQNELSGICQKNQPETIIRRQKLDFQPRLRKILALFDSPCDVASQSLLDYEAAVPLAPPLIPYDTHTAPLIRYLALKSSKKWEIWKSEKLGTLDKFVATQLLLDSEVAVSFMPPLIPYDTHTAPLIRYLALKSSKKWEIWKSEKLGTHDKFADSAPPNLLGISNSPANHQMLPWHTESPSSTIRNITTSVIATNQDTIPIYSVQKSFKKCSRHTETLKTGVCTPNHYVCKNQLFFGVPRSVLCLLQNSVSIKDTTSDDLPRMRPPKARIRRYHGFLYYTLGKMRSSQMNRISHMVNSIISRAQQMQKKSKKFLNTMKALLTIPIVEYRFWWTNSISSTAGATCAAGASEILCFKKNSISGAAGATGATGAPKFLANSSKTGVMISKSPRMSIKLINVPHFAVFDPEIDTTASKSPGMSGKLLNVPHFAVCDHEIDRMAPVIPKFTANDSKTGIKILGCPRKPVNLLNAPNFAKIGVKIGQISSKCSKFVSLCFERSRIAKKREPSLARSPIASQVEKTHFLVNDPLLPKGLGGEVQSTLGKSSSQAHNALRLPFLYGMPRCLHDGKIFEKLPKFKELGSQTIRDHIATFESYARGYDKRWWVHLLRITLGMEVLRFIETKCQDTKPQDYEIHRQLLLNKYERPQNDLQLLMAMFDSSNTLKMDDLLTSSTYELFPQHLSHARQKLLHQKSCALRRMDPLIATQLLSQPETYTQNWAEFCEVARLVDDTKEANMEIDKQEALSPSTRSKALPHTSKALDNCDQWSKLGNRRRLKVVPPTTRKALDKCDQWSKLGDRRKLAVGKTITIDDDDELRILEGTLLDLKEPSMDIDLDVWNKQVLDRLYALNTFPTTTRQDNTKSQAVLPQHLVSRSTSNLAYPTTPSTLVNETLSTKMLTPKSPRSLGVREEASLTKGSSSQLSLTTPSLKRIPNHRVKLRRVFVPRPINGIKHAPSDDDFALGPCEPMSKPPRTLAHLAPSMVSSVKEDQDSSRPSSRLPPSTMLTFEVKPIDGSPFNDLLISQPRGSKMYSPSDIGSCSRRALLRDSYSNTMDAPLKDDEPIDEAPTQDVPLDDAIATSSSISLSIKHSKPQRLANGEKARIKDPDVKFSNDQSPPSSPPSSPRSQGSRSWPPFYLDAKFLQPEPNLRDKVKQVDIKYGFTPLLPPTKTSTTPSTSTPHIVGGRRRVGRPRKTTRQATLFALLARHLGLRTPPYALRALDRAPSLAMHYATSTTHPTSMTPLLKYVSTLVGKPLPRRMATTRLTSNATTPSTPRLRDAPTKRSHRLRAWGSITSSESRQSTNAILNNGRLLGEHWR